MTGGQRVPSLRRFFLAVVVLASLSCDSSDPTPPNSGIAGTVTIGPTCPVEREDEPCPDEPYQAEVVIRTPEGEQVAVVRSDADGRYRVALEPGTYTVEPQTDPGSPLPFAEPIEVVVLEGSFTTIDIEYDSGIR